MERRAEEVFAQIEELGDGSMLDGAMRGVEEGWYQGEIADSAYELERKLNAGRHVVVGVTGFLEGNDEPPPPILRIGPEVEEEQRRRLDKVRRERDATAVESALARVRADAADADVNLMPAIIDAVRRRTRRSGRLSTPWPTCSAGGSKPRGSEGRARVRRRTGRQAADWARGPRRVAPA